MTKQTTENYLKLELKKKNTLLFVLVDSEVSDPTTSSKLAEKVEEIGASAILIGGSFCHRSDESIRNRQIH